jgi:hypothetical protein
MFRALCSRPYATDKSIPPPMTENEDKPRQTKVAAAANVIAFIEANLESKFPAPVKRSPIVGVVTCISLKSSTI